MQSSLVLNPKFYYYFHPTQMNKKKKRVEHPNKVVKITKSPRTKPIKRSTISEKIDESLLISSQLLAKFPLLGPDFCQIDALDLAPRLLGKHLKKDDVILRITEVIVSLKFSCFINNIIDLRLIMSLLYVFVCVCVKKVEAYRPDDSACHGRFGITPRTAPVVSKYYSLPQFIIFCSSYFLSFIWKLSLTHKNIIPLQRKLGKSCWGMRMFGLKSRIYYTKPMW